MWPQISAIVVTLKNAAPGGGSNQLHPTDGIAVIRDSSPNTTRLFLITLNVRLTTRSISKCGAAVSAVVIPPPSENCGRERAYRIARG